MAKAKEKTQTKTKSYVQLKLSETEACALKLLVEDVTPEYDDETVDEKHSPVYDALCSIDSALSDAGIRTNEYADDCFRFDAGTIEVLASATATRAGKS